MTILNPSRRATPRRAHPAAIAALAIFTLLCLATISRAQSPASILKSAAQFSAQGDAAAARDLLLSAHNTLPDDPYIAYHLARLQADLGNAADAERLLLPIAYPAATARPDTRLTAAARYNLGVILFRTAAAPLREAGLLPPLTSQADPSTPPTATPPTTTPQSTTPPATTDEPQPKPLDILATVDILRRSERAFRAARDLQPADPDAPRNIETVQRLIDLLLSLPPQDPQQQSQPQQDPQSQDQQQQNDQQQQDQPQDQQSQDQQSQNQQSQDQQSQDQQNQDQQQPSDASQDPQSSQDQQDQAPADQPQDQPSDAEQDAEPQPSQPPPDAQPPPEAPPQRDLTAARILDKERRDRQQRDDRLRAQRSRLNPVDKDW